MTLADEGELKRIGVQQEWLKGVPQTENDQRRNLRALEKKRAHEAKVRVNRTGFPSCRQISQLCLMTEANILTVSWFQMHLEKIFKIIML